MASRPMTEEKHRHIYEWCQEGCGMRKIARLLRRTARSISREVRRNAGQRGYQNKQAHAMERARRSAPRGV